MKFLILLTALLVNYLLLVKAPGGGSRLFGAWLGGIPPRLQGMPSARARVAMAGLLLVPSLAVWALCFLAGSLWSLLGVLLEWLVLLFCLGPRSFDALADELRQPTSARPLAHEPDAGAADYVRGEDQQWDGGRFQRLFDGALGSLFGVILWFQLLGAAGAVLFVFSARLRALMRPVGGAPAEAAAYMYDLLAWLPVRVSVLAFALAGALVETLETWRDHGGNGPQEAEELLYRSGLAATGINASEGSPGDVGAGITDIQALVWRAVIVWLGLSGLATVAGWLG